MLRAGSVACPTKPILYSCQAVCCKTFLRNCEPSESSLHACDCHLFCTLCLCLQRVCLGRAALRYGRALFKGVSHASRPLWLWAVGRPVQTSHRIYMLHICQSVSTWRVLPAMACQQLCSCVATARECNEMPVQLAHQVCPGFIAGLVSDVSGRKGCLKLLNCSFASNAHCIQIT